jgi:hypothetical protein
MGIPIQYNGNNSHEILTCCKYLLEHGVYRKGLNKDRIFYPNYIQGTNYYHHIDIGDWIIHDKENKRYLHVEEKDYEEYIKQPFL